jgi:hypothetical protein
MFAVLSIAALVRLPSPYGIYCLIMLLTPMTKITDDDRLASMTRYVLVLFPAFVLLGLAGKRPWVHRLIVYPSLVLLGLFTAMFVHWGWAG